MSIILTPSRFDAPVVVVGTSLLGLGLLLGLAFLGGVSGVRILLLLALHNGGVKLESLGQASKIFPIETFNVFFVVKNL